MTFTDYLESIHGKDYVGTDDCMPDDFNDWLQSQDVNDICEYAEKYAILTRREMREEIEKFTADYVHPEFCEARGRQYKSCFRCVIDALLKKLEEGKI